MNLVSDPKMAGTFGSAIGAFSAKPIQSQSSGHFLENAVTSQRLQPCNIWQAFGELETGDVHSCIGDVGGCYT